MTFPKLQRVRGEVENRIQFPVFFFVPGCPGRSQQLGKWELLNSL